MQRRTVSGRTGHIWSFFGTLQALQRYTRLGLWATMFVFSFACAAEVFDFVAVLRVLRGDGTFVVTTMGEVSGRSHFALFQLPPFLANDSPLSPQFGSACPSARGRPSTALGRSST